MTFYNVIFRCGGFYFNENMNNINTELLSNDIEIIFIDTKEFIFNNDYYKNEINGFCISIPTKLPTRTRYKILFNKYNATLLFTPYLLSNQQNKNNQRPKAFVYELNLNNLKWKQLIKYNDNNNIIYGSSLCLIQNGTKLLQFGGTNENGEKSKNISIYNYSKKKNDISSLPTMPFERNENLFTIYDEINNEVIIGGGLKDKYHENKIIIFNVLTKKWTMFNYIFNHNHREPIIWFNDHENNKNKQILFIAGNELENWKRIGFVETIDTKKDNGTTIVGKYLCVAGGKENTLNKNINISIKQMFNITNNNNNQNQNDIDKQQQLQQIFANIFPRVTLLQSWL